VTTPTQFLTQTQSLYEGLWVPESLCTEEFCLVPMTVNNGKCFALTDLHPEQAGVDVHTWMYIQRHGKQNGAVGKRMKQCFRLALSHQGKSVAFWRQTETQNLCY